MAGRSSTECQLEYGYHFDWKQKLEEMFGGTLPTFDDIHHLEKLYQRHNQNDELHNLSPTSKQQE